LTRKIKLWKRENKLVEEEKRNCGKEKIKLWRRENEIL